MFSPKDKIADWLESYTRLMELAYWGNSVATSAEYDEAAGRWTVAVQREAGAASVTMVQRSSSHIVKSHALMEIARLEAAGFDHDWGDEGSGYYIGVGAADLVADGQVRLAHGQVDHLTKDAVVLADGTTLPADLVITPRDMAR